MASPFPRAYRNELAGGLSPAEKLIAARQRIPDRLRCDFNPRCKHDRCSFSIVQCPECQAYTAARRGSSS